MAPSSQQKVKARIDKALGKAKRRDASVRMIIEAMKDYGVTPPVEQFTLTHAPSSSGWEA